MLIGRHVLTLTDFYLWQVIGHEVGLVHHQPIGIFGTFSIIPMGL